ncbi:MAG: tRNA (adenosine(37)-N6)-threonylcarbamoyltransferase complex ATPase subunit type 1 TsaE [Acidobacteria bacterium]|nr:tRNA (adenosine(37)-N6)-threonylcarbamoyltransferase complex ATPase subunit type 1 TsaE [Acidobacteriota bacterium]
MGEGSAAWKAGKIITSSEGETLQLARAFGETLRAPCVVLLYGQLGSGKTTFARGLVAGLGVQDLGQVRSPSFTLVNIYSGRFPVYHVDLYRLDSPRDLETIGMDEILSEEAAIVVEWAEKLPSLPEAGWKVVMTDAGETIREIEFSRIGTE